MMPQAIRGWWPLVVANGLAALVASGFGVVGVLDPTTVLPGIHGGDAVAIFAGLYAVRALPLGVAVVVLLWRRSPGLVPMLVVAGAAQVGDSVIGTAYAVPGMMVGGAVLAVIHLMSAGWLIRRGAALSPLPVAGASDVASPVR
ncbi:hypothetical protein [Intrasporangium sp.]|uniref:hypothetical protein n=1 Tax=Intrasporangium sp. TaxID=1925024 RepID=UPI00293B1DC6|nr:hypothetical protein [Intrasporangium sp.]MDV3221493.1 hypothetical protein [Intrasporangium sp.]